MTDHLNIAEKKEKQHEHKNCTIYSLINGQHYI